MLTLRQKLPKLAPSDQERDSPDANAACLLALPHQMQAPELTEKLLNDAGGWQAMKQARAFLEMGRVTSASYAPPLLKGVVREGETDYRGGLKIFEPVERRKYLRLPCLFENGERSVPILSRSVLPQSGPNLLRRHRNPPFRP